MFCGFNIDLTQSVLVLVILILIGALLRKIGVLKFDDSALFARIVTDVTLPALIFCAVSQHPIKLAQLWPPVVLVFSELASGVLAFCVGKMFRLSNPQIGALVLASMFGSSAFLGYAVIKDLFHGDSMVLAEAAIISELGVGVLIFTLGVGIAIHFGENDSSWKEIVTQALKFFRSPIFFALVAGIVVAQIGLTQTGMFFGSIDKLLQTIASANTLMVTLTIGVMLRFQDFRKVIFIVVLASVIKLIIQPLLAGAGADILNLSENFRKVVVIEAAMPSAALAAVFAKRYNCDGELASILVFATFISSIFTIVTISLMLF